MTLTDFLFSAALMSAAAKPVAVVNLTGSPAVFPTNQISVIGCQAGFDGPSKGPPAACVPFPIRLEIKSERPITSSKSDRALEIEITNESGRAINLPVSPQQPKNARHLQFISLGTYLSSASPRVGTFAFAFSDAKDPLSVVSVAPGRSILYIIPFDTDALQIAHHHEGRKIQIEVELILYLVSRAPKGSDDVSTQKGNRIVSEPFTLPE